MRYTNLANLGPRRVGQVFADTTLGIESLEFGLTLTDRYRSLLEEFCGAVVFDNGAKFKCDEPSPLNDEDGFQVLEVLYGLGCSRDSILGEAADRMGRLPDDLTPIGESSGGNLICWNPEGAILLWDHKSPKDGKGWLIAPSIDDFLNRLQPIQS